MFYFVFLVFKKQKQQKYMLQVRHTESLKALLGMFCYIGQQTRHTHTLTCAHTLTHTHTPVTWLMQALVLPPSLCLQITLRCSVKTATVIKI